MTPLDLERSVLDTKPVVQFLAHCSQECIVVNQFRLDQVSSKSHFGSTHSPNMQVMHFPDTGEFAETILDCLGTYSSRYGVQRQINGFAQ